MVKAAKPEAQRRPKQKIIKTKEGKTALARSSNKTAGKRKVVQKEKVGKSRKSGQKKLTQMQKKPQLQRSETEVLPRIQSNAVSSNELKKARKAMIESNVVISSKRVVKNSKPSSVSGKVEVETKMAAAKTVAPMMKGAVQMPQKKTTKAGGERKMIIKNSASQGLFAGAETVAPYEAKPGEEYMSAAQLEHFEQYLLQWRDELLHGAKNTVQDIQISSANFPDPVDRASQEEEFSLELRTRDRERKLLKKIGEILQRIKDKSYGYCDDCGAEIGLRRLEARPTATQCIECKTIAEIREKQIGDIGKDREEE